ncbi:hypothetical protein ABPG77_009704 [Micractinium sp. CCAP 211/92]
MELTPPGQLFRADFRSAQESPKGAIKLLQWNIERGYQLAGIIEELRRIDADILSLQEVDVGCDRSGGVDTGIEIAKALGLNYVFLCEFEELRSPLRDARSQGGGVHGNAILSKFDFADVAVVPHRTHPVDWNNPTHPLARREPRRGERAVLRATVTTPQGPLVAYNAHLEVFCGLLARIAQLSDIFADARAMADAGFQHQAILGDMNTMAHGIARLSPSYCCDHMRFRSIGMDEAVVWHRHVLPVADPRYAPDSSSGSDATRPSAGSAGPASGVSVSGNGDAPASAQPGGSSPSEAVLSAAADQRLAAPRAQQQQQQQQQQEKGAPQPLNPRLLAWGLSEQVAYDATNPGFFDPFDPKLTVTLDNPKYRWFGLSLMKGKLDWVLLRRLRPLSQAAGNDGYALSDHRWLAADVAFH